MTRESVYPDDVICGACHSPRLDRTDEERDGIAWWLSYECPDCGATGDVEERHNGVTKYHDDVTTPRRSDLERASMERRGPRMSRSLSIAHTRGPRTGRKSTPFSPTLNLRVGLENRRTERGVPTLPTLPRGVSERGRKSTPPFGNARAHWERPGLERNRRGGSHE